MKPGIATLPVMRRLCGSAASSSRHSSSLRPSFHRIAGRSGSVGGVEQGRAVHLARQADAAHRAAGPSASSAVTAMPVAVHQSDGSCSDQPGRGRETDSGACACPAIAPESSTSTAFTLDVPMSIPRNMD